VVSAAEGAAEAEAEAVAVAAPDLSEEEVGSPGGSGCRRQPSPQASLAPPAQGGLRRLFLKVEAGEGEEYGEEEALVGETECLAAGAGGQGMAPPDEATVEVKSSTVQWSSVH